MTIKFITGNKNKFKEIQAALAPLQVEQVDLALEEIQSLEERVVMEHKMQQALLLMPAPFIIEDTSMFFECFNFKFPGTLIKSFQEAMSNNDMFNLVSKVGQNGAKSTCIIGYADASNKIWYFEGHVHGNIVEPKGDKGFGYDPIFKAEGLGQTFAEMEMSEKQKLSSRGQAVKKLKEFLLSYEKINPKTEAENAG